MKCYLHPLMKFDQEVVEGYQSSSHQTKKLTSEVSAKVSASFFGVKAEVDSSVGSELTSSFTTTFNTSTKRRKIAESNGPEAWYLYQAITEVRLSNGEVLTFGGGIQAYTSPQALIWEKDLDDGGKECHIRSVNNSFLSAQPEILDWCRTASKHSDWETFRAFKLRSGKWAFKTFHGTWLKSHPEGRLETSGGSQHGRLLRL